MTSINIELYQALIEAGTSPSTATAAARMIRDIDERVNANSVISMSQNIELLRTDVDHLKVDITQLKTDIGWIKIVGSGFCGIIVTMLGWIIVKLVQ
jgi:hypothetical protein